MQTITDLLAELAELNPCEIAEKFQNEGIKGTRFSGCACPVAVYIDKHVNSKTKISVGPSDVRIDFKCYALPQTVKDFILQFDGRLFPELCEGTAW